MRNFLIFDPRPWRGSFVGHLDRLRHAVGVFAAVFVSGEGQARAIAMRGLWTVYRDVQHNRPLAEASIASEASCTRRSRGFPGRRARWCRSPIPAACGSFPARRPCACDRPDIRSACMSPKVANFSNKIMRKIKGNRAGGDSRGTHPAPREALMDSDGLIPKAGSDELIIAGHSDVTIRSRPRG